MRINGFKLEIAMANIPMSYVELAKASNTTQTTLARLKRGTQNPRPETVGRIAKALGVKVSDIIDDLDCTAKGGVMLCRNQ